MAFHITQPDKKLSPLTGMGRAHWIAAGAYLLEGAFRHLKKFEEPLVFPKQSERLYPGPNDPAWKHRACEFEALARTFMLAAPILKEKPDLKVAGWNLRDYYANQILAITDPKAPQYVGKISELEATVKAKIYQHTVEGAALVLGLIESQPAIWDRYSKAEKDQIAALLSDFAHARTNGHNWRWFNVMMGSFLRLNGYPVDWDVITDHLQNILAFYAGDGWYRDGALFDYYSAWAFQFYGPIWCNTYGYRHEPEIARIIEKRHAALMKTYGLMFSRDGWSHMWGRSSMYRCAASAPLAAAFLLKQTPMNPGWARRIASGNLLQFVTRDDFLIDGVPSVGFYGKFEPMIQSYSCAASVYWISKIYLALHVPATSPFWTAQENDGDWKALRNGQKTAVLDAPGLVTTIHGKTGAAEIRNGRLGKSGDANYNRLVYNTHFPWEADSSAGHTAGTYCNANLDEGPTATYNVGQGFYYVGERGGVLYRQMPLRSWMARIDLAEIIIPGGVLRIDRLRVPQSYELHLGHFALPHLAGEPATVKELTVAGKPAITAKIAGRSVALVALHGWDGAASAQHAGLNAEAAGSTVIYAKRRRARDNSGMDVVVTLLLHKSNNAPFASAELNTVKKLEYLPWAPSGAPAGMKVTLRTGKTYLVDFVELEGGLRC